MDQPPINLSDLRPKLRTLHVKPTVTLTEADRRALAHLIASPGFESVLALMCDEIAAKMRSAANNLANPAVVLEVYGREQELRLLESLRGSLLTILERQGKA